MTAQRCIPVEEIYRTLDLPEQDPRRIHLHECPRCGALADQFRAFVEASAQGVDESQLAAAEASLKAALERELAAPAQSGWQEKESAARRTVLEGPKANWWDAFFAPAWKPALAIAGVIVVAAIVVWPRLDERPGEPVLRGAPPAHALTVAVAARTPRGLEVRWQPMSGATSYQVRMYSTALEEIGRVETAETAITIAPEKIPPANGALLVRVAAIADGDELAISDVKTVERP